MTRRRRGGPRQKAAPNNILAAPILADPTPDVLALADALRADIKEQMIRRLEQIEEVPVGYGAAYEPSGRRGRWQVMYRCVHCGSGHARMVWELEAANGVIRAGCGLGPIALVVARVHRRDEAVAA